MRNIARPIGAREIAQKKAPFDLLIFHIFFSSVASKRASDNYLVLSPFAEGRAAMNIFLRFFSGKSAVPDLTAAEGGGPAAE